MSAEPPVSAPGVRLAAGAAPPDALSAPGVGAAALADDRPAHVVDDGAGERERARVQAHTLRLLFATQVGGGVGLTIGVSIGALLAARIGGVSVSGLAQSAIVIGAAL